MFKEEPLNQSGFLDIRHVIEEDVANTKGGSMDAEHILLVVEVYEKQFNDLALKPIQQGDDHFPSCQNRELQHAHWMLLGIRNCIGKGELEKAQRWLGFVQGILWTSKMYTIAQLRKHNRSS